MIFLFASALLLAFVSLVLASQLPAPAWLWALDGVGFSLAVAALSGIALILARVRVGERWAQLPLPAASATIALACHGELVDWLSPHEALARIDFWRIQLAALSVVGGSYALIGGVAALTRPGAWYHTVLAGVAVTAGLFALGPVLITAGVPVDWRAFLGLAGLGLGAFAAVEAARKVRTP